MKSTQKVTIALTALLMLSMLAFAAPAFAVITAAPAAPASGAVGSKTLVAVTGSSPGAQIQTFWENLGGAQIGNQTTYADGAGAANIVVTIPNATAGPHSIIVRDVSTGATSGSAFTVTPAITMVPTRGIPGDLVAVTGTGFAANANITITFNGVDVTAARTTTDATGFFTGAFTVPNIAYGPYTVQAADNATVPNIATATFTIGASITISPTSAPAGAIITVTGRGFTKTAGLPITLTAPGGIPLYNLTTIKTAADGSFTGQFIVPSGLLTTPTYTRYTLTATDGTIVGTTSGATGGLRVTGDTGITATPSSAAPGATITVTGQNFTNIAGTPVQLRFGNLPTQAGNIVLQTATTDANGAFTQTITVPTLPTNPYFINATDAYNLNASFAFSIAITNLFANATSGPAGSVVALTGYGLTGTTFTLNLTNAAGMNIQLSPSSNSVAALLAGTVTATIPSLPVGTYTLVVVDNNGLTTQTTFAVTAATTLTVNPSTAPVGTNVRVTVTNYAPNTPINFWIYNSTYLVGLAVTPVAPFTAVTTNGTGTFIGQFQVPALALGAYNILVNETATTTPSIFNATASFNIGPATLDISTRSSTYKPGDVVSFNVQSTFATDFTVNVYGPERSQVVLNFLESRFIQVGALQVYPIYTGSPTYYLYGSAFQLPNDAPLGTWTWNTTFLGTVVSGSFNVTAAGSPTSGSNTTDIIAILNALNQTTNTIKTDVNTVRTTLQALNATIIAINGNVATVQTSIGTITTSISNMQSTVNSLSGISGQITTINNGIASVQTTLGSVTTSLQSLDAVLGAVAGQTATLNTSLGTITTSLSSLNTRVTSIEGNVATVQTDLGTLKGTVTGIQGDVATIKTDIGTLQANVGTIQTDVSGIQQDVSGTRTTTEAISPLVIVAIVLALIAAIAAIASIVMMRRKIAG